MAARRPVEWYNRRVSRHHSGQWAARGGQPRTFTARSTTLQSPLLAETRALLRQYNLHPRKALGQNFLVDGEILDAVVDAAELANDDVVLEVGPGVGILTNRLAEQVRRVVAVELDDELARVVDHRMAHLGNVTVRHANVLHTDLRIDFAPNEAFKVVANIPYYITAPILRLFLEGGTASQTPRPHLLVLMVQREVAQRLAARPGKMSLLSLSAQVYAEPEIVRIVPATAFYPPPEVQSAIVRLRRRTTPAIDADLLPAVFRVAKAGFHDRRKQIHNALTIGLSQLDPVRINQALENAGIDRQRRAETLSVQEWGRLTTELIAQGLVVRGGEAFPIEIGTSLPLIDTNVEPL